ncbi:MAG: DUF1853 family protein [Halomonadaceae bacterium]|nr:MAG: DUF1853 family protein [Halomonadaceae bacterium]
MHQAGQLFQGPQSIYFNQPLPGAMVAKFRHWDEFPEEGPALLTETPHPRLGLYFERLYACLMRDILGWELLATNLPVRRNGITLGELDFLLRNPHTQAIEHHEIAIKFYLGYQPTQKDDPWWYGPNSSDRLDIKTRRLLEHQSQLTRRPETVAAIAERGFGQPQKCGIFMPGYLFYPTTDPMPAPLQTPQDHQRGHWLYLDQAHALDCEHWVALRKPHWLGPWLQPEPPVRAEAEATLEQVQLTATPRLFARLAWVPGSGCWQEVERFFVVPGHWPGKRAFPPEK